MAMLLIPLIAVAMALQGAAIVSEMARPGRKRHVPDLSGRPTPRNDTGGPLALGHTQSRASDAPGLTCGMTTPVAGASPGTSNNGKLQPLTLQECLDACVATAACKAVVSHHHGIQSCWILTNTYEGNYVPYDNTDTPPYVSNKLAGANCDTRYDFLFHGCPRGTGVTWYHRSSSMRIWECAAQCDGYADCLAFETNGCLDYPNCGGNCYTFHGDSSAVVTFGGCDESGNQESYLKVQLTTPSPTSSPTASPTTPSPTLAPTSSPSMFADLVGDPHVTNFAGKRFDVHYAGDLMLLQIPRGAGPRRTLLRLDGHVRKVGGLCTKQLYLDSVHLTGRWVPERSQGAGLTIAARKKLSDTTRSRHKQRFQLGVVLVVVSHAQTDTGINYLNLHVSNLERVGMPIGGLLGEDDFSWARAMPAECQAEELEGGDAGSALAGSVLMASAM